MKIMSYSYKLLLCNLLLLTTNALKAVEGFSLIPAGSFTMGNSMTEDADITDAPIRTVALDAFYMGKYEVTKAEWDVVRTWGLSNGYTDLASGASKADDHPAHSISWYDMVKWCNAHSEKDGLIPAYYTDDAQIQIYKTGDVDITNALVKWNANGYRLPTEAEWEKAARGGLSGKRFPWGDTISHSQANYYARSSFSYDLSGSVNNNHPTYAIGDYPYTSPVGAFASNGYGLYDMAGNVVEWCWDWYGAYAAGSQTNPRGSTSGAYRVHRGGGWGNDTDGCRVANRSYGYPTIPHYSIGFRVARSAKEMPQELIFSYGFKHINQDDAGLYLVEANGMRKYAEWQYPPITYWGPQENNAESSLVYKFPIPNGASSIFIKASDASWDFYNEWGGSGRGCSSLEVSKDGISWVSLRNSLDSRNWGFDWNFDEELPSEVVGGGNLWVRMRFLVEGAPNSSYTVAQFGRSTSSSELNIFEIKAYGAISEAADSDADGLMDSVETNTGVFVSQSNTGTNPNNADTDADGVPDGLEVKEGTSPVDATRFNSYSKGLVAYYSFSGNANDESGNRHDIPEETLVYSDDRDSQKNMSLALANSFSSSNPIFLNSNAPRTFSQWVKVVEFPNTTNHMWVKPNAPYFAYPLSVITGNGFAADGEWWMDTGSGVAFYDWGAKSGWAHMVIVYEGDVIQAKVYCDGVQIPLKRWVFDRTAFVSGDYNTLHFSTTTWEPDNFSTKNLIDDVRVYDRALTEAEVGQLYRNEVGNLDSDSDGDGLADSFETNTGVWVSLSDTGTDPNKADTDEDGLTDGAEVYEHSTNPNLADTDGDGVSDGIEIQNGSGPLDPASVPTFDLTFTTPQYGSFSGAGSFSWGATAMLTATPNAGYIFSGWNGDASGMDNPLSLTMNSDKNVGANFEPDLGDSDVDGYSNYDEIVTYKSNPNNFASIPGDPDGDGFFVAGLLEGTGLMDAIGGDTMIVNAAGTPLASGIAAGGYFTLSEAQVAAAVASEDYAQLLTAFVPFVSDDFVTGLRDYYIGDAIPGFHYFYQHLGTQPSTLLGRPIYTFFGNGATLESSTELALVKHSTSITAGNLSQSALLFFDPYDEHALVLGAAGTDTYSSDAIGVFDVPVATIALHFVGAARTLAITAVNGSVNGDATYPNGAIATLTATPNPGYIFSGWTGDATGTDNPLSLTMNADKTVGATFEQDLGDADGDGLSNYAEVVTHGTNPNLADTDGDGYSDAEEVQWGSNPKDSNSYPEVYLTISSGYGGYIQASGIRNDNPWSGGSYSGYVPLRSTVTLTAYADYDHRFSYWSGDAFDSSSTLILYMDNDKSVQANFEYYWDYWDSDGDGIYNYYEYIYGTNPYDYDTDDDELGDGAEVYHYGTSPTLADTDGDGYSDGIEIQNGADPLDPANVPTFDLTFTTSQHGSLSGAGSYPLNTIATLTATANPGYLFSSWTGDASGADNPLSLTMDSNKTVGANFGPDYGDNDGDALSNYAEVVTHGTNPNLADTDGDGYSDGIEIQNGTGPLDPASVPTFDLTLTTPQYGSLSGAGTFPLNTNATLTATANAGYIFTSWTGDASGTENPLSLNMNADKTVGATFEQDLGDSDGDGLSNYDEIIVYKTNPLNPDSDGDYSGDGFEVRSLSNPNVASESQTYGLKIKSVTKPSSFGNISHAKEIQLEGNTLAAWESSGNGNIHLFNFSEGQLTYQSSIASPDTSYDWPAFGASMSLLGNRLITGDHITCISGIHDGRGYQYNIQDLQNPHFEHRLVRDAQTATYIGNCVLAVNGFSIFSSSGSYQYGTQNKVHVFRENGDFYQTWTDGYNKGIEFARSPSGDAFLVARSEWSSAPVVETTKIYLYNVTDGNIHQRGGAPLSFQYSYNDGSNINYAGNQHAFHRFAFDGNKIYAIDDDHLRIFSFDDEAWNETSIDLRKYSGGSKFSSTNLLLGDDFLIVSSPNADCRDSSKGCVVIFDIDSATRALRYRETITNSSGVPGEFGSYVALDEQTGHLLVSTEFGSSHAWGVVNSNNGNWIIYEGLQERNSSFQIVEGSFTWHEAKADAEARGGRLAVINTQEKIEQVNAFLQSKGSWTFMWIGLSDDQNEGQWKWIGGQSLAFSNWQPNQPSGSGPNGGDEDYGHILPFPGENSGKWNDLPNEGGHNSPIGYLLELPEVTLEIVASSNGSIAGVGNYAVGATATLTATANPGYIFTGWTGDALGTDNPLSLTMDSDKTVGAYFGPDYGDNDGDALSNYAEVVTHGTNPNLADTDGDGYSDGIEIQNGTGPLDPASVPTFDLILTTPQYGSLSGAGTFPLNTNATLTATANAGYIFTSWTGDASGTENPLSLNMNADKTVGATFEQDLGDSDGDGLSNYREAVVYGTNPAKADTDDDGLSDAWELGVGRFSLTVTTSPLTWKQARDDARSKGGDLACFPNQEIWNSVRASLGETALDDLQGVWIGASDTELEGVWKWVNGLPFTFANWGTGRPNSTVSNSLDFLEISGGDGAEIWKWYDRGTTSTRTRYLQEVGYSTNPLIADADADGLTDGEEQEISTNPFLSDSDGDGLTDGEEINLFGTSPNQADSDGNSLNDASDDQDGDGLSNISEIRTHLTNPVAADSDADGLNDGAEINDHSTNPNVADSDGDGLTDAEEITLVGTNPTQVDSDGDNLNDANDDQDGDGLGNLAEIRTHLTNPINPDSDSDNLTDREEIELTFTNPNHADTDGDSLNDADDDQDGDGLNNLVELRTHLTNPAAADSDGDALTDTEEITLVGTNPNQADTDGDSLNDADDDQDGDGLSNISEIRTHLTNPVAADGDADGLNDGAEINEYSTDPNLTDTDGDGLTDGHEVNTTQSNPKLADSNGDGLRDGLVVALGKNPMENISAFMSALMANRTELGLHKTEDITDMRAGSMMIERAAGTNKLQFRMKLQKSNDMHNWQDDGEAVFEAPMSPLPSKQFYRFGVK